MITFTPEAVAQWRLEHADHPDHPDQVGRSDLSVRISVAPGGCAGLKYVMEPAGEQGPADEIFVQPGLTVLCAAADLPRLDGLRVDYVDAMVGGGFRFENPNAGHSCGCGASFGDLPA